MALIDHDREAKFFVSRARRHLCTAFRLKEDASQATKFCLLAAGLPGGIQAAIDDASGNAQEEDSLTKVFLNLAWAHATLQHWRQGSIFIQEKGPCPGNGQ